MFADALQWLLLIGLAFLFGAILGDLAARRRSASSHGGPGGSAREASADARAGCVAAPGEGLDAGERRGIA